MAYSTILVIYYIKTVAFEMTGFPTIIIHRIKAVGFKMTGLIITVTKLRSFFKRTISVYIVGKLTKMAFWSVVC